MVRRIGIALVLVASMLVVGERTALAARPNVVVVMLDDADSALIRLMPKTRRLIVREGVSFRRFYVADPNCCPSRASFLLGEYPHTHHVLDNDGTDGGFRRFRALGHGSRTIAKEVKRFGYTTGLFGKYLNDYGSFGTSSHVPPFWDRWFGMLTSQEKFDYRVNDDATVVSYGGSAAEHSTTVFGDKSLEWIDSVAGGGSPFFSYVSFVAPHSPYDVPGAYVDRASSVIPRALAARSFDEADVSDKPSGIRALPRVSARAKQAIVERHRGRTALALQIDDYVGELIALLDARGVLEETYVVVTSDQGWLQGQHRRQAGARDPYEESIRVPLVVRGPGIAPASGANELASTIDLFATVSDIAGGNALRDGRSLLPILRGHDGAWRTKLLVDHIGDDPHSPYHALVTHRYKYVEHLNGEVERYDLVRDPYELDSIGASATLRAALGKLGACRHETCRQADR